MTKALVFSLLASLTLTLWGCSGRTEVDLNSNINIKVGLVVIGKREARGKYFLHVQPPAGFAKWVEVDSSTYHQTQVGDQYPPRGK
jgi:hypothetical protein